MRSTFALRSRAFSHRTHHGSDRSWRYIRVLSRSWVFGLRSSVGSWDILEECFAPDASQVCLCVAAIMRLRFAFSTWYSKPAQRFCTMHVAFDFRFCRLHLHSTLSRCMCIVALAQAAFACYACVLRLRVCSCVVRFACHVWPFSFIRDARMLHSHAALALRICASRLRFVSARHSLRRVQIYSAARKSHATQTSTWLSFFTWKEKSCA